MWKVLVSTAIAVGWVATAWGDGSEPASTDPARESSDALRLTARDCNRLSQFQPSADLNASAVDAYGRPVAPADDRPNIAPPFLHFWIEAPTIEQQTWRSEPKLMELTLDLATGEITSDGRPVPGLSTSDLVKACGRIHPD